MLKRQTAIVPRSLAEAVYFDVREKILSGELEPGMSLGLKEQANRFGISIMPVREAIKKLHQEGLVIQEPQRGATVAPVSLEDMEDVYRVRTALEVLAVEEAAKRITDVDYKYLNALLDSFQDGYERGDTQKGRESHRLFHLELYQVSGSKALERVIPPLVNSSERYQSLSIQNRGSIEERRLEHQMILDACMKHDGEGAGHLLATHLGKTLRLVRKEVAPNSTEQYEERGGLQ